MRGNEPLWDSEHLRRPHQAPDKARRVRSMFNAIAPRYELVNTVFSAGTDARWRRKAIALAQVGEDDDVLDVACGTGDFGRSCVRAGARLVVGCDFAHQMLLGARGGLPGTEYWCEADALCLPFRPGSFSVTSCAFGVRNFADLEAGLREMFRVLKPGGRAVILEFSRPKRPLLRRLYEFYATRLMPRAAALVSRDQTGAYRYLPCSVVSFLPAEQMCATLRRVGFARATATPLTFGVVTVYVATRD